MTDGESNTAAIIAQDNTPGYAATLCDTYAGGGFNDWYLPANRELYLLAEQDILIDQILDNDGDITTHGFSQEYDLLHGRYWSSTEYTENQAWRYHFGYGSSEFNNKNYTSRVRAIRAF